MAVSKSLYKEDGDILAVSELGVAFIISQQVSHNQIGSLIFNENSECIGIISNVMKESHEAIVAPSSILQSLIDGRFQKNQ